MTFEISQELWDEALKARNWYETKGMKVAKTPPIPEPVAAWIVRHCQPRNLGGGR